MSTKRVKGITIEIDGSTTKLDKALSATDGHLKRVQADLKEVERALKLDPTNVELLAQKQRLLAERSEFAAERLSILETAASQLDDTLGQSELDRFNLELDLTRANAENAARELADFGPALAQVGDSAEDAADGLGDVGDSAGGLKGGFDTASMAISTFAGESMSKLLDIALQAAEAIWNLDEATEEYRESMAMLNTAYEMAGYSQETATGAYRGFFAILGETGRATEASQLLAQLATSSEDVAKWTDIAAGVYGTFGDSLPIEGLIEAANETAKTGQVTGVLADALNWVGLSEDSVNQQLSQLNDETSRARYLMSMLSSEYSAAADTFYENNESIIAARDAQADMDESLGTLGQAVADVKTKFMDAFGPYIVDIISAVADVIGFIAPLIDGIAFAVGAVIDVVKTLVGWIQTAVDWFLELIGISGESKYAPPSGGGRSSSGSRSAPAPEVAGLYRALYEEIPNVPALAAGGVVPPNDPFLAVLGDNRREPEVVSPYSTIKQAAGDAFAERGGRTQAVHLYVHKGGGLMREFKFSLDSEAKRQGMKLAEV